MAKRDDIPKTDPSEIESLIQRLKRSDLEPRDAQLVGRLLRLALSIAFLLIMSRRDLHFNDLLMRTLCE
jgi:hypothetical protein